MPAEFERPTLKVSNVPQTITGHDLLQFLESKLGKGSIFALEISTERKNWKPRDHGRVQFTSIEAKHQALSLSLSFKNQVLRFSETYDDIVVRPIEEKNRVENSILHVGFMVKDDTMCVVETWEGVRGWVMPERKRVEFWVWKGNECFKLDVHFGDVWESDACCLDDGESVDYRNADSLLFKVKYAPRIYQKMSGPNVASKFHSDHYHICKEDVDFLWVRTDFSDMKSIGQSTCFCWQVEGSTVSEIFASFPYYREEKKILILEDGEEFSTTSNVAPLVEIDSGRKLSYEVLFQLNSLVHNQKISLAAADSDLIGFLSSLDEDTAIIILQKLHQLKSTCYDPVHFLKFQLQTLKRKRNSFLVSSQKKLVDHNVMRCHRALITPSKIFCMGPEVETCNHVVKSYVQYASDFMRVTFVDEDWNKLPPNAVSTYTERGLFTKPLNTGIYHRILSILQDGIVIGDKRFEFLAFSASQLRSNSVWMFASNDDVRAEDIRKWMGSFDKIRSVSKCAARMGQLFSSSTQTILVHETDVEVIPDIEVTTDGFHYCFSDGIGKISPTFARQIAQKCGLNDTPSAFQIRYGGYKGVIAVDRNSFKKLSLRSSMLKFESRNRMLNITKCSESMPCYLNREVIVLLSTLGVKDEIFLEMQETQLCLLAKILTNRDAALLALEGLAGADSQSILIKMLLYGYEPNVEPYLSILLLAHYENQLSDLRSRCRIFVPKGRILLGSLDESGILNYGQVYARVTMTKTELNCGDQSFFRKVDEKTSVVIGKVVITKNPCLHPGDVRVLEAVDLPELEEKGWVDCLVFPQKGKRPHPNECSGGDLDGDLFFISWDGNLIPSHTIPPMDYSARRHRIMDHDVTLEEIQHFFVDYMINDTLGAISTAYLIHADREPDKAMSEKCKELARLHSSAVDFAKTGAPDAMPVYLKPREFPDFMERRDKPTYKSSGVLGKLYRATLVYTNCEQDKPPSEKCEDLAGHHPNSNDFGKKEAPATLPAYLNIFSGILGKLYRTALSTTMQERSSFVWSKEIAEACHDHDLEANGFEAYLEIAEVHRDTYAEKLSALMNFYGAESEDEILTGNLRNRAPYLRRDNRKYGDMKDRILLSVKDLKKEAKGWFENSCKSGEHRQLASAWYHVTYHPNYCKKTVNYLSFPWVVGDILLNIKAVNKAKATTRDTTRPN